MASSFEPSQEDFDRRLERLELVAAALLMADVSGARARPSDLLRIIDRTRPSEYRDAFAEMLRELIYSRDRERGSSWYRGSAERFIEKEIRSLERKIDSVSRSSDDIISRQNSEISAIRAELHSLLTLSTLGIDTRSVKVQRFLPIKLYLSDDSADIRTAIDTAINAFVAGFGFEVSDNFPGERGSWKKKWFIKSKELLTQPEVTERLQKVEKALEMKGLDLPQAEVDHKKAAATAQLIKAVSGVKSAALQVGSILLVKTSGRSGPNIQVRTLSARELIALENNQALLSSPRDLLQRLSEICGHTTESPPHEPPQMTSGDH